MSSPRIRFAPLPDRNSLPGECSSHLAGQKQHKGRRMSSPSQNRPPSPTTQPRRLRSPSSAEGLSKTSQFLQVFRPKEENSLSRSNSAGAELPLPKSPKLSSSPNTDNGLATLHSSRTPNHRLLNGRVYGKKPGASDSHTEPDFVEWGYGGMGSVKSQQQVGGRMWGKVQSDESEIMGGDEDDDGSGMGWVKRRREARQRRESEAREDRVLTPHHCRSVAEP